MKLIFSIGKVYYYMRATLCIELSKYISCAGIVVHTPEGTLTARAILLMCSVDLPARAILLNMKQWNGVQGCLYCESTGTVLPGDHLHRYVL